MFETYRMLGSEHDAELAHEAEKWQRASLVETKAKRRRPTAFAHWNSLRRLVPAHLLRAAGTRRREKMSKKLTTTIVLVFTLATVSTSTALADPPPNRAANGQGASGVCNMLNVDRSTVAMAGMNNSAHGNGYDNMANDLIIPACF